ncbi:MAG: ATP-binding protein [Gemmatimonadales bacterium]
MAAVQYDRVELQDETHVVRVRHRVREWASKLGFSLVDQTKLVTAASELARNAVVHGGGGVAEIQAVENNGRRGIRIAFVDNGPGIPDVAVALRDGFTTVEGLGLGLGGAKRLVHDMHIESRAGAGTTVTITRWK